MKGMTVQLVVGTITSYDPFGAPIESEETVNIDDVLVGQPTTDDIRLWKHRVGKKTGASEASAWVRIPYPLPKNYNLRLCGRRYF